MIKLYLENNERKAFKAKYEKGEADL